MAQTLKLKSDTSELTALLKKMKSAIADSSEVLTKVVNGLFNILDLSDEVRTVKVDNCSTGTGELLVRFEPSERLRRISIAILAGDIDGLAVEHNKILFGGLTNDTGRN